MNLSMKQTHGHREPLPKGEEVGGGWSERLGLADVSYYTWNG